MFSLLLTVSILILNVYGLPQGRHNDPLLNWRIVGGKDAEAGQFPYVVSFRARGHFCGGSILNEYWILTAAHCLNGANPEGIHVIAGSHLLSSGGDKYQVSEIFVHEKWDDWNMENDIALVKLTSPITFSNNVQPIPIETQQVEGGKDAILCGWGDLSYGEKSPDNLQFIVLKTTDYDTCRLAHWQTIYTTNICTFTKGGEGACHGDSGGPLVSDGKVIGVVSWGAPCAAGKPDVFTKVADYARWIQNKTQ